MYIPGLDIALSIFYLYFLWEEGKYSRQRLYNKKQLASLALLWQAPGFILGASAFLSLGAFSDFSAYSIFILELWDTPILPLISLLPPWLIMGQLLYHCLLYLAVPVLACLYYLPALLHKK